MVYLLIWIIMGALVAVVANSKGRNAALWFLYGALIWPVALVHASVLPAPDSAADVAANQVHDQSEALPIPVEPVTRVEKITVTAFAIVLGVLAFLAGIFYL